MPNERPSLQVAPYVEFREKASYSRQVIGLWLAVGVAGLLIGQIPSTVGGTPECTYASGAPTCWKPGIDWSLASWVGALAFLVAAALTWRLLRGPVLHVGDLYLENRLSFLRPWSVVWSDVERIVGPVHGRFGLGLVLTIRKSALHRPWDSVTRHVPLSHLDAPWEEVEWEISSRRRRKAGRETRTSRPAGKGRLVKGLRLSVNGEEMIQDPGADQLSRLIAEMIEGEGFLILDREGSGVPFMQTARGDATTWQVEYRDSTSEPIYETTCEDPNDVCELMIAWASGSSDWRTRVVWVPLELH